MKMSRIPNISEALPGRSEVMSTTNQHYINGHPLQPPFPANMEMAMFGLGCFWGAERKFWQCPGVFSTAVGYAGGHTPNPTYAEVCTGMTGHNEVVRIIFATELLSYLQLLKIFWESHNPTQGMRQGNDTGTQYRSGIYTYSQEQLNLAIKSKEHYQKNLSRVEMAQITTEIVIAPEFYFAEDYHQQYLAKNPAGYCGLGGTGVCYENPE